MTDAHQGMNATFFLISSDGHASSFLQDFENDWVPLSQGQTWPIDFGSGAPYLDTFGDLTTVGGIAGGSASPSHGGGGGGGTTPPTYVSPTENGLTFVINWDSSVGNAPTGFVDAFKTAIGYFLANSGSPTPITITLNVGWGEAGGQRLSIGALGESLTNINMVPYSQLYGALTNYGYVPSTDPLLGTTHSYWVASAEEKALGLISNNSSLDGSLGFSSRVTWDFANSAPASGQYDFVSVAEHEISETMGRISLLGASISDNGLIYTNGYSPLDLFRYSAQGTLSLSPSQAAYFSPDGGLSSGGMNPAGSAITYFNSTAGGDRGDWQSSGANSAGNDAYNAFASTGIQYTASAVDSAVMHALGYSPAVATV